MLAWSIGLDCQHVEDWVMDQDDKTGSGRKHAVAGEGSGAGSL